MKLPNILTHDDPKCYHCKHSIRKQCDDRCMSCKSDFNIYRISREYNESLRKLCPKCRLMYHLNNEDRVFYIKLLESQVENGSICSCSCK